MHSGGAQECAQRSQPAQSFFGGSRAWLYVEGHGDMVTSVCFSPDGWRLASGSADETVRLWGAEMGACVKTLEGHGGPVTSLCFSPDGRTVASGSQDLTARETVAARVRVTARGA